MNTYNLKNNEAERWREAIALAQTGWWEADPDHQVYFCSDFIADLLSLLSKEISFSYLYNTIREDYHDPVSSNFLPENKKKNENFPIRQLLRPVLSGYIASGDKSKRMKRERLTYIKQINMLFSMPPPLLLSTKPGVSRPPGTRIIYLNLSSKTN